ncbi:MAG: hypothetical protein HY814_04180 [Candidatus Riflebacteria bacterium]|nr:hypothetical protein [Candidatus Riflebacteria bacterium]
MGTVLLALALLAAMPMTAGCIQDGIVAPTSVIQARLTVPAGLSTVGIRANLVGSGTNFNRVRILGPFPNSSDLGFCDVEGDFTIETRHADRHFVVARGANYDLGYGIVYIPAAGQTIDVFEVNLDSARFGSTDPRLTDSLHELIPKTAATAVFVVFAEDFGPLSTVEVVGDFNSFDPRKNARPLWDDGSQFDIDPATAGTQVSGDRVAGDGAWTRIDTTMPSGELHYGFVINKDDLIRSDPYEEKSSGTFDPGGQLASVMIVK